MFVPIFCLSVPGIVYVLTMGTSALAALTSTNISYGLAAGALFGGGLLINFEAFRRIDGFIAFLMFNISILITFLIETFAFGSFVPTWLIIAGGSIIIGSTVLAEVIKSKCEKEGL